MVDELEAHAELEDLALIHEPVAPKDRADDVDGLPRTLQRFAVRDAVPSLDDLRTRRAEAEDRPATRQRVERRYRLADQRRRSRVHVDDPRSEADARRVRDE